MAEPAQKVETSRPKTGGRKKGVPNKVTGEVRAVFKKIFKRLAPEAENWIRETALGIPVKITQKDGLTAETRKGADPGKAADLLLRLAEFHIPKLGRTEITGADGGPLLLNIEIDLGGAK